MALLYSSFSSVFQLTFDKGKSFIMLLGQIMTRRRFLNFYKGKCILIWMLSTSNITTQFLFFTWTNACSHNFTKIILRVSTKYWFELISVSFFNCLKTKTRFSCEFVSCLCGTQLVGQQFLAAIETVMKDNWTPEVEQAWAQFLHFIAYVMREAMVLWPWPWHYEALTCDSISLNIGCNGLSFFEE